MPRPMPRIGTPPCSNAAGNMPGAGSIGVGAGPGDSAEINANPGGGTIIGGCAQSAAAGAESTVAAADGRRAGCALVTTHTRTATHRAPAGASRTCTSKVT